jgi:ATP-binding cassette subfamily B (MDR/TAP) protein 1
MTKFTQNASTYIADSGSLAEEVFSSIRTAQAFGAQKTLADLFDAYVKKASVVGIKGARISSLGLAVMFFVIYSGYALAFFYGAILVSRFVRSSSGNVAVESHDMLSRRRSTKIVRTPVPSLRSS